MSDNENNDRKKNRHRLQLSLLLFYRYHIFAVLSLVLNGDIRCGLMILI